jgi:hypothetical protein
MVRSSMAPETRRLKRVIAPLTRREEKAAAEAVFSQLQNGRRSPSRPPRLLGVELRIDKPARPGALPSRLYRVVIADYASRRVLDVAVDHRFRVIEETHYRGVQPAYTAEEIAEARDLAERDDRVARAIARRRFFVEAFSPPASDRRGSRAIGLRYVLSRRDRGIIELAEAVVDLHALAIIAIAARQSGGPDDGGSQGAVR